MILPRTFFQAADTIWFDAVILLNLGGDVTEKFLDKTELVLS